MSGLTFTGIDFETANSRRASICAVGITKVKDGQVTARYSSLVNPPEGFRDFNPMNIDIHGITPDQVENAPEWVDIHQEINELIGADVLVAHNAAFDKSVFFRVYDAYDLEWPENPWLCTLNLAKKSMSLPSFGLAWVSKELGLPEFSHHDAAADAEAASRVLLSLADRIGLSDLSEIQVAAERPIQPKDVSLEELGISDDVPRINGAFVGETICFTGALRLKRNDAIALAVKQGATAQTGVTKKTSLVVVGGFSSTTLRPGASMSSKLEKALTLQQNGQPLEILTEVEFLQRLAVEEDEIRRRIAERANTGSSWKLPEWAQTQARDPNCGRDWYRYLKLVLHPEGRATGGEPCIWCGTEIARGAHWTYRNRHVCDFACNSNFKRSARRYGEQLGLFTN
ncbi:exonuclease domain-containing protein [Flaviflexus sp.]|uniref:exonuclease domain-containing protein n=1 Tax=Flaviflexus sp. TaxID=1969482 RepID=UPI003F90E015